MVFKQNRLIYLVMILIVGNLQSSQFTSENILDRTNSMSLDSVEDFQASNFSTPTKSALIPNSMNVQALKAAGISKKNDKCMAAIMALTANDNEFDVHAITTAYDNMKSGTPRSTKTLMSDHIADKIVSLVEQGSNSAIEANEKRGAFMRQSPRSDAAILLATVSDQLPDSKRRKYSYVDAGHASTPVMNESANRLSGGHNIEHYNLDALSFDNKFDCFIGQDGEIIGVYVDDEHPKTTRFNFDEAEIINNERYGKIVAISPVNKSVVLSTSPKGYHIESFNKQLMTLTQYPVFTISPNKGNNFGDIYAGRFASFKKNDFTNKVHPDFESHNGLGVVRIPQNIFYSWMNQGIPFNTKDEGTRVVDITVPFTAFCYEGYLKKMGKSEMPGRVYGITTIQSSDSAARSLDFDLPPSPFFPISESPVVLESSSSKSDSQASKKSKTTKWVQPASKTTPPPAPQTPIVLPASFSSRPSSGSLPSLSKQKSFN